MLSATLSVPCFSANGSSFWPIHSNEKDLFQVYPPPHFLHVTLEAMF